MVCIGHLFLTPPQSRGVDWWRQYVLLGFPFSKARVVKKLHVLLEMVFETALEKCNSSLRMTKTSKLSLNMIFCRVFILWYCRWRRWSVLFLAKTSLSVILPTGYRKYYIWCSTTRVWLCVWWPGFNSILHNIQVSILNHT